jgi:general secretion pathway protein K
MKRLGFTSQAGIALFQVLLITAVIAILAIQFTQTARNQIAIAQIIVDRVQAQAELRTLEAELLYSLMTEQRYLNADSQNPFVQRWNFFGKPFQPATEREAAQVELTIQDLSGLIGLHQGRGNTRLIALIHQLNADNTLGTNFNAEAIGSALIDWQDDDDLVSINGAEKNQYSNPNMPSNLPLQTHQELLNIQGFTPALVEYLKPLTTIRPQRYFNPMLSPPEVLATLVDTDRMNEIIRLRDQERLTISEFTNLSGLESDESLMFFPSGLLRIDFSVTVSQVKLRKTIEIYIQPYDKHPYLEHEIRI